MSENDSFRGEFSFPPFSVSSVISLVTFFFSFPSFPLLCVLRASAVHSFSCTPLPSMCFCSLLFLFCPALPPWRGSDLGRGFYKDCFRSWEIIRNPGNALPVDHLLQINGDSFYSPLDEFFSLPGCGERWFLIRLFRPHLRSDILWKCRQGKSSLKFLGVTRKIIW